MRQALVLLVLSGFMSGGVVSSVDARVTRLVVEKTTPYAGGRSFGNAGTFERLEGTVYMEVDPWRRDSLASAFQKRRSVACSGMLSEVSQPRSITNTSMTRRSAGR